MSTTELTESTFEKTIAEGNITSIPTLMAFREGILVFAQPGALPATGLNSVIEGVSGLDVDAVKAEVAQAEAAQAEVAQAEAARSTEA